MPVGLVAFSTPLLFAQNLLLTAGLACALVRFSPFPHFAHPSHPTTACAVAFLVVLAKEIAEVFVEAGTGAISDGVAALLGALAVYAWAPGQKPRSE